MQSVFRSLNMGSQRKDSFLWGKGKSSLDFWLDFFEIYVTILQGIYIISMSRRHLIGNIRYKIS